MNAEQRKQTLELIESLKSTDAELSSAEVADLLQELADAPEVKPAAWVLGYYAGYLSVATVNGRGLPTGTALYTAPPEPSVPDAHPDDIAVDRFAAAMKTKMAKSRAVGRYGWDDPATCSADDLRLFLVNHIAKGDPVDVGNFAMMLFNRHETTAQPHPEPPADPVRDAERFVALINEIVANAASPIVDAMMEHEDVHGAGNTTLDGFRKAIDAAIERDKLKGQS